MDFWRDWVWYLLTVLVCGCMGFAAIGQAIYRLITRWELSGKENEAAQARRVVYGALWVWMAVMASAFVLTGWAGGLAAFLTGGISGGIMKRQGNQIAEYWLFDDSEEEE